MLLRVRLFAAAADACGARVIEWEAPEGATADRLLAELALRGGPLLPRCRVAVDRRTAAEATVLSPGQEIAVLPPVSGGAGAALRVGPEPILADAVLREVSDADLGGQVVFLGTVRGRTDGEATSRLEYESYSEMALEVLEEISNRVAHYWPGVRLAIWHRTGLVAPGEAAVAVAAASAHRADAFAAARLAIERVKAELPVWKREWTEQGTARWVDHP